MKTIIYNQEGKKIEPIELPAEIFAVPMNKDLVHQAVVSQMANSRRVLAHAKDRSERRGGGAKPWRQKGTGRARHGSVRSPIWRGGGVTFGPSKERVFTKKINKKMKRRALLMALSSKAKDKEIVLLDKLELAQAKTREMLKVLRSLRIDKTALIVLDKTSQKIIRTARNIPEAKTISADSLNVIDVLSYKYLLMPKGVIEIIKKTYVK